MAVGLENFPNSEAPSVDYEYGSIKDNTGANDGTPINRLTNGDIFQFFARLLDQAGMTANGDPDNTTNGYQYYEALLNRIAALIASSIIQATESVAGKAEIATQTETNTGSDDERILTALKIFTTPTLIHSVYGTKLIVNSLPIGDWNMDSSAQTTVNHGITASKFRGILGITIIDDSGNVYSLERGSNTDVATGTATTRQGMATLSNTGIILTRLTSGFFDSTSFDQTSYNRGYVTFLYEA